MLEFDTLFFLSLNVLVELGKLLAYGGNFLSQRNYFGCGIGCPASLQIPGENGADNCSDNRRNNRNKNRRHDASIAANRGEKVEGRIVNYWKIFCMEQRYHGLWQRWFKHQCVAVGWPAAWGFRMNGKAKNRGWAVARRALKRIQDGDWIIVQLKNHRVGRIGQVVNKEIKDDQWNPLVLPTKADPVGEMGRRVNVRWNMSIGPFDPAMVVKLPESKRLSGVRQTIAKVDRKTFQSVRDAMADESNWRNLLSKFKYEESLSDYIAAYPHHVEDGLQPYPSEKVREKVFKNGTRSDVLLLDRNQVPVIVECKQGEPEIKHVQQLKQYMKLLRQATGRKPRGILIHGGARKLRKEVRREVNHKPRIEVVQYSLSVGFAPCR
jgi:hypothetical protein